MRALVKVAACSKLTETFRESGVTVALLLFVLSFVFAKTDFGISNAVEYNASPKTNDIHT